MLLLAEAVTGVVQRCGKQCEAVPTLQNSNRETHHKYDNDGEGNVAVEGKIRGNVTHRQIIFKMTPDV